MSLWRLPSIPVLAALLLLATTANAQPALTIPYTYDSTFVIGGYDLNRVWLLDTAKNALGMSTVGYTHAPHNLAYTYVTGTDSGAYRLYRLLQRMGTLHLKAMYAIGHIAYIGVAARAMEQYPGNAADVVQIPTLQFFDSASSRDNTLFDKDFIWGVTDTTTSAPGSYLLAGYPRYTRYVFKDAGLPFVDSIRGPMGEASGERTPVTAAAPERYDEMDQLYQARNGTSFPGAAKNQENFRATFTMRVDTSTSDFIDSTLTGDTLAYAVIYRRDTASQTSCKCGIYVPLKICGIRKSDYLNLSEFAGDGYQEIGTWFSIFRDSLNGKPRYWVPTDEGWFGEAAGGACIASCSTMFATRQALPSSNPLYLPPGSLNIGTVEESDLIYRFYTTRRVPVQFLRGRLSNRLFEAVRDTNVDFLIKESIDGVYNDTLINNNFRSFGLFDEPWLPHLRTYGYLSRKAQKFMRARDSNERRLIMSPVIGNFDGLRVFSGDLDSTQMKLVQTVIADRYLAFHDPISINIGLHV
jgi:hypothetical protein